jgi:hypothetical protein
MALRAIVPALLIVGLCATFPLQTFSQQNGNDVVPAPEPRPSPVAIAATKLDGDAYVRVVYGSPRMRGREVFGGLVPFGEIWRTGANEATEITFAQPVTFGGQPVDAGSYSLFTIPGESEWTIVLNRGLGQWGAYAYDEGDDLLRLTVPSSNSNSRYEAFTVRFEETEAGSDLVLLWDRTRVSVPIAAR